MTETTDHPIRLRNTLTRRVERFVPLDWQRGDVPEAERRVRLYVCGPTVYDRAHLGNARSAVVFDVLFRLLRHVYGEDRVTYVRNITDIDDKIIARAKETGRPVEAITEETIRWYHEDMDALGCLRPTHEPRATEYLPQMIAMIQALIEKGHAYEAEGHVLFAVRTYEGYGRLSGRSVEDMIAGARVEVAPFKRSPADFVLWKPSGEGVPGWDSPWGRGRPGWHIECSAMARDLLGGAFDIHGGGLDLQFPHHENEIAQSRCAHPDEGFAQVWIHNEMLRVEGEKMSKSLGNFLTVRDMLDRGVPGEVIRLVLLGTHYGKPLDWTERKVEEAHERLAGWYRTTDQVKASQIIASKVKTALTTDLNTHLTLAAMDQLPREYLKAAMQLVGIPDAEGVEWFRERAVSVAGTISTGDTPLYTFEVTPYLQRWQQYRLERQFEKADAFKSKLEALGLRVEVTKGGPRARIGSEFDPSRLKELDEVEEQQ